MEILIKQCKADTLKDLQSTGEETEITDFIENMTEICKLFDEQSSIVAIKGKAKTAQKKAERDGARARQGALKGIVLHNIENDEEEIASEEGRHLKPQTHGHK